METHAAEHSEHSASGHEQSTIRLRPILWFGVGLLVLSVVTFTAMTWLFDYFAARQARIDVLPSPLADPQQLPPEPRLQVSPGADVQHMREAEEAVLQNYRWVDREAGIVGIPIDRAMDILAEKGLPTRSEEKAE
jgi:hypothetical protein